MPFMALLKCRLCLSKFLTCDSTPCAAILHNVLMQSRRFNTSDRFDSRSCIRAHYVNIALGKFYWRMFLILCDGCSSLILLWFVHWLCAAVAMCCKRVASKTVTVKLAERVGRAWALQVNRKYLCGALHYEHQQYG